MSADPRPEADPFRVLFVCAANIARSAYAARRATDLARPGRLVAAGAGIPGSPGRGLDQEVVTILKEQGIDHLGHVSRRLGGDDLAWADLVLVMEFAQQMRIFDRWPEHDRKVFGLLQFAETMRLTPPGPGVDVVDHAYGSAPHNSIVWDVEDPHGRGAAAARGATRVIDDALHVVIPFLRRPSTD
jgi:protein-tyrosine-phosphatase